MYNRDRAPQGNAVTARDQHLPVVGLAGYEVLEPIARGGMGVVFKARQVALDRIVALKVMIAGEDGTAETLERFRREAKAAARLDHPHIVPIYDVGHEGPTHFFTMQLIEGEPLSRVAQRKGLSPRRALEIAGKIAGALEYAHAQGILHRDVKPGNILIDSAGEPRLADFGLAKDVSSGALTAPGAFLGTVHYASPEQIDGDASGIGPRSDVYSLGATLYEALTGQAPFSGATVIEVVAKVLNEDPAPPRYLNPQIQAGIEAICLKAMEKDPARRYASAGAMEADIRRYLAGEAIEATPAGSWSRRWRWVERRRSRVLAAVGTVLVLAAVGAGVAWMKARKADDAARHAANEDAARQQATLDAARRKEREAVLAAAAEAESLLEKALRVSAVLARWKKLAPELRSLETGQFAGRIGRHVILEPSYAPLSAVEEFLEATPRDGASRATALALAGWAEHLADSEWKAGKLWRESRVADPDVPFAALMEALAEFARYVESQPMPMVYAGGGEIAFMPIPPEDPERAILREHVEALAAEAGRARVWGKESADDFRAALGAMRSLQSGDLAAAEAGLTRALSSPDLSAFANGLLFARSHVRYMRMDFEGGLADTLEVVTARPGWAKARFHEAELRLAIGRKIGCKGDDPGETFRAAIRAFSEALELAPDLVSCYNNRGTAWQALGDAQAMRGGDPREAYRESIRDYDRALKARPDFVDALANRGISDLGLARAAFARGEDPREACQAAIDDAGAVIAAEPSHWMAYNVRADALLLLGESESHRGADPRERYRAAIADLEKALSIRPSFSEALGNLGRCWLVLGDAEGARGGDPEPLFRKALEAQGREIEAGPGRSAGYGNRGAVGLRMAQHAVMRGGDPSEWIEKAIADLGKAIERDPADGGFRMNRGLAWQHRAEREMSLGGDPSASCAKAMEDLDAAVERNPESAMSYGNRARIHQILAEWLGTRQDDPREEVRLAIADYDEAIRRDTSMPQIRANRAQALVDFAQAEASFGGDPARWYQEAIAECDRGLERNREHAAYHSVRGIAWYGLGAVEMAAGRDPTGSFEKALTAMGEVISRNPTSPAVYNNRGGVRFNVAAWETSTGKDPRETLARAVEDFGSALRLNPEYVDALFNRGFARMEIGRAMQLRGMDARAMYVESLADYEAAVARNPSHWMAHANRAAILESLGEWGRAEEAYLAVQKVIGSRPDVLEALDRVRKAKGDR